MDVVLLRAATEGAPLVPSAKFILHSTVSRLLPTQVCKVKNIAKKKNWRKVEELSNFSWDMLCHLCSTIAWGSHTWTSFHLLAPIPSHLAFLSRTFKLAGAMLKVCLFKHLPEAWKYRYACFSWSLICKLTYPVAQTRQGDTGNFLYPYLLSIT